MYELRHFATLNRAAYKTPNDKFQFSTIYDFQQIVPVRRDVFRYLETLPWRLANSYAVAYWSVLLMATYGLVCLSCFQIGIFLGDWLITE